MNRHHLMASVCLAASWLGGCSGTTKDAANSDALGAEGGAGAPCDPLAPSSVTLGTILGVGENTLSDTVWPYYVADQVHEGGQDRVFVSNGQTLYRKHVTGTGQQGARPDADYSLSFQDPSSDASDGRALLIQIRGGAVTAMALGPANSKSFLGASDAGDESLTVVDASAINGFKLQGLPGVVEYVADVNNGDVIVITAPMDAWDTSEYRLFSGAPSQMIERPIVSYSQALSGEAAISYSVGSVVYTLHLTIVYGPDAGPLGSPGPASLDTGGGASLPVSLRLPTPPSLSGFSFTCSPQ